MDPLDIATIVKNVREALEQDLSRPSCRRCASFMPGTEVSAIMLKRGVYGGARTQVRELFWTPVKGWKKIDLPEGHYWLCSDCVGELLPFQAEHGTGDE